MQEWTAHWKGLKSSQKTDKHAECLSVAVVKCQGIKEAQNCTSSTQYWYKHYSNHLQIPSSLLAEPISEIDWKCQIMLAFLATLAAGARTCYPVLVIETTKEIFWPVLLIKADSWESALPSWPYLREDVVL